VKPYVFLALGVVWLIVALVLYKTSFGFGLFGFKWQGGHPPAIAVSLFHILLRVMPHVIFLGWIAPVLFGLWLLWRK
jgi:hypothetical protein